MSFEWRELPLGECLLKVVDNRGKTPPLAESKTPYGLIEVNALVGPDKSPNYSAVRKFVSAETYNSWFRSGHPVSGDLLFSTVGSVAEVALFNGGSGCIAQNIVGLRPNTEIISPNYLYYALVNPVMQLKLRTLDISSVQPSIKVPHLLAAKIQVPPLHLQEPIGEILEALDDRITLLRETNATLEAIAQALFKSWFVDFDPVRAKAEGRQPEGMDAATAALFPDSFEESELGLVPKGWEVLPLRQLCAFQKGCSYKGDGLADGEGAYMFNLGCFNEPRVYAFQKVKRYVGDYKPKHQVYPGDLIIANTDMTQQRDILGRPLLVPSGMEPGFISHHVFKVEVGGEFGNQIKNFLFFSFQQAVFRERAVGYATGTTVLALPRDELEEHCVVLPSQSLLMAFSDVVSPLLAAIHENEERATLLTQLRDTLLPRLISGQLRLPEAEATVEEVL